MKKVLIALDYDKSAKKVAEFGYMIGKSMGAEIALLHVLADQSYYETLEYAQKEGFMGFKKSELNDLFANGLKSAMQTYLHQTAHFLGNNAIKIFVKEGECADVILSTAKSMSATLVIMGSHSRNWLEKNLIGSESTKVLEHTSVPLLIVPNKR